MSVAGRFAARFYRLQDREGDDPALWGNRLAVAAEYAVGAGGVGVSVFVDGLRLPVGASNDHAVLAERLQFTTGDGPCLDVQETGLGVRADSGQLRRRWPEFYGVLSGQTPFRAVMAVPLASAGGLRGCMDLFFESDVRLSDAAAAAAEVVGGVVGSLLAVSTRNDGPAWFQGPPTLPRRSTMIALGLVSAVGHVSTTEALAAVRAYARRTGRTIDDTAHAVIARRLQVEAVLDDSAANG